MRRVVLLLLFACAACKREDADDDERKPRKKSAPPQVAPSAIDEPSAEPLSDPASSPESSGPRYLRPDRRGKLVDAFRFPSVPASMIEDEVSSASSKKDAAGILRRFGLASLDGDTGSVWVAKASLVDRQARERVLVVTFVDASAQQDAWIVFLGSTREDRVLKIDGARVTGKSIEVDARELHTADVDDVVATWSCGGKACMRAWTMQRNKVEMILDLKADAPPTITDHSVNDGGRTWTFDAATFTYR